MTHTDDTPVGATADYGFGSRPGRLPAVRAAGAGPL